MSIRVFYNEIDSHCCAWLSNLMDAGHIRPGVISDKSIADLTPDDVRPYDLAHFFGGIAGWDYALTLAGWRFDGRVTWTGSPPCQPFSTAGQGKAQADSRHLWPAWFRLIRECRPEHVFGEQVAAAIGWGWLDGISTDLEAEGYAVGSVVLGAHSVGAPHIRQRLFWVAYAQSARFGRQEPEERRPSVSESEGGLAEPISDQYHPQGSGEAAAISPVDRAGEYGARESGGAGDGICGLGDSASEQVGRARQPWEDSVWLPCADGKARRVGTRIRPLAHGIPARASKLRAYGNSIVPQITAVFVRAFMETQAALA